MKFHIAQTDVYEVHGSDADLAMDHFLSLDEQGRNSLWIDVATREIQFVDYDDDDELREIAANILTSERVPREELVQLVEKYSSEKYDLSYEPRPS